MVDATAATDEQLSISTCGWRRRSSSSNRTAPASGRGCRLHLGAAALDVIAVHVPLDVGDVVVAQQRVELTEHVVVRLGAAEVEHELVAAEHGLVALGRQRPLGVGAVQVAVGVDHLRLDPDPEVHAQTANVVDQRSEARRVGVGRDHPVAEPGVSSRRDPNHPSSSTNRSMPTAAATIGEIAQASEVVVEVDRLPRVQQHRARRSSDAPAATRRWRWNPQRRRRQAVVACDATTSGVVVRSPGVEHDLAGVEQLAELHVAPSVGQPLGEQAVVAAPRQVRRHTSPCHSPKPDVPAAKTSGDVLVRRPAAAVLDECGTVRPRARAADGTRGSIAR